MLDKIELQNDNKSHVKIWCDGCYDLVHFGHANSLRQAKSQGDYLVVGVHTDEDIIRHKGPPIFTLKERCQIVRAIKWVDEIVEGAPYITTIDVLNQYGCDFCCHGDDVSVTDKGADTYRCIKNAGKYREVRRTTGISTTGVVDRILSRACKERRSESINRSPWTGTNNFLLNTEKIVQFWNERTTRKNGDRAVYVVGGFDLFHIGHLQFLEKARALGEYLIVGLYGDEVINHSKGENYPIMNLHERLLSLLACKYVSDVVIGAPFAVTKDLMENYKIDIVAAGKHFHKGDYKILEDPYTYPKDKNVLKIIDSESSVTTEEIVDRILKNKLEYKRRNEKKEKRELDLINTKTAE